MSVPMQSRLPSRVKLIATARPAGGNAVELRGSDGRSTPNVDFSANFSRAVDNKSTLGGPPRQPQLGSAPWGERSLDGRRQHAIRQPARFGHRTTRGSRYSPRAGAAG